MTTESNVTDAMKKMVDEAIAAYMASNTFDITTDTTTIKNAKMAPIAATAAPVDENVTSDMLAMQHQ